MFNASRLFGTISYPASRFAIHSARREGKTWQLLPLIPQPTVANFRKDAFIPSKPVHFKVQDFDISIPAARKWFSTSNQGESSLSLNYDYLAPFGGSPVPMELTSDESETEIKFKRAEAPLDVFLDFCRLALNAPTPLLSRLYLAQASLSRLPETLQQDLPPPKIVLEVGAGDVYDANVWMGLAPTYTPLHRDPNPNLFIQLAGTKRARILPPAQGDHVFAHTQAVLQKGGSSVFRGDEMMEGGERKLLEETIWTEKSHNLPHDVIKAGYEIEVKAGQAVFIPQGWWHSIKGMGSGMTASVNWWFR